MENIVHKSLAASFALVGACALSAQASASPASTPAPLPSSVTSAAAAHLNKMPASERVSFINNNLLASVSETQSTTPISAAKMQSMTSYAARSSQKCYMRNATGQGKNALGMTLYSWTHVGAWCVQNGRVTKSATYQAYTNTNAPGWTGTTGKSWSGVLYNQGRSSTQFHFTLGAWGIDVQHPTHCAQVDGYANSGALVRWTCSLA